jgi:hypothetical protein
LAASDASPYRRFQPAAPFAATASAE